MSEQSITWSQLGHAISNASSKFQSFITDEKIETKLVHPSDSEVTKLIRIFEDISGCITNESASSILAHMPSKERSKFLESISKSKRIVKEKHFQIKEDKELQEEMTKVDIVSDSEGSFNKRGKKRKVKVDSDSESVQNEEIPTYHRQKLPAKFSWTSMGFVRKKI